MKKLLEDKSLVLICIVLLYFLIRTGLEAISKEKAGAQATTNYIIVLTNR